MNPGTVLAENVSRRFRVYPQRHVTLKEAIVRRRHLRPVDVWALKDVSFRIEPGESVGFMGRNGSGKTTLLRLIAGVFRPTSGRLAVTGQIGSLLELGAGFHQDFTGRDNIYLSASIYGLKKDEVDRRFDEIVEFSELERFIDLPIRTYSAGMHMRLGFSIAVNVDAEILLLDEVFAVGDEAFQRKCIDRILAFREQGKTIAFVSHSAAALERMCDRALLLSHGRDPVRRRDRARRSGATSSCWRARRIRPSGRRGCASGAAARRKVTDVRLVGADGEPREVFAAGDPLVLHIGVEAYEDVPPAALAVELRDAAGALLGRVRSGARGPRLGRNRARRGPVRDRAPAARRRPLSVQPDADGPHRRPAVPQHGEGGRVQPCSRRADARGVFLLEGDWSLAESLSPRS